MNDLLREIADDLKEKSALTEGVFFEQFINDYFKFGSQKAYENMRSNGASDQTQEAAKDFVGQAVYLRCSSIRKELELDKTEFRSDQVKVVEEFYRDYITSNQYERAMQRAMQRIERSPALAEDENFQKQFHAFAKKITPRVNKNFEIGIQPDDGLIFMITVRESSPSERPLSSRQMKDFLSGYMGKVVGQDQDVSHEVDCLVREKHITLSSTLAYRDLADMRAQTVNMARSYDNMLTQVVRERVPIDEQSLKNLKVSPAPMRVADSEKMDVLRNFIASAGKPGVSTATAYREAIQRIGKFESLNDYLEKPKNKDRSLLSVMERYHEKIVLNQATREDYRNLLLEGYSTFMPVDQNKHIREVDKEVVMLQSGKHNGLVKQALSEYHRKGQLLARAQTAVMVMATATNEARKARHIKNGFLKKHGVTEEEMNRAHAARPFMDVSPSKDRSQDFNIHTN